MDINGTINSKLILPLMCWDIYAMHMADLRQVCRVEKDFLKQLQLKNNWQIDIDRLLSQKYEALVLTNRAIEIEWVSEGFFQMTGYRKKEVLGRSPRLLQGKNTHPKSRKAISDKLNQRRSFSASITNYRKDGEEYLCHVEIHALFNHKNELTHFLALEREITNDDQ